MANRKNRRMKNPQIVLNWESQSISVWLRAWKSIIKTNILIMPTGRPLCRVIVCCVRYVSCVCMWMIPDKKTSPLCLIRRVLSLGRNPGVFIVQLLMAYSLDCRIKRSTGILRTHPNGMMNIWWFGGTFMEKAQKHSLDGSPREAVIRRLSDEPKWLYNMLV